MSNAKIYYAARIEGDGGSLEIDGAQVVLESDYHKLAAERDRLLVWLREIADLDPRKLYAGYDAVRLAQSARKEVGDED
jgi:hypothetical protein